MIIYNRIWLRNLLLIELVENEHSEGSISDQELSAVRGKYPVGFYSPNLFIRAGLLVLTAVVCLFSCALLTLLFTEPIGIPLDYGWFFFLGAINYIALEFMVRNKFHFRSGVDDALLWMSFGLFLQAYSLAIKAVHPYPYITLCAFVFVLSLYFALRFSDMLMSLISYLALFALIYFSWQKAGSLGISTLPFVLMLSSGIMYWLVVRSLNHHKTIFYTNSLTVLQAISLITLYASGNYYLVKELGAMLNKTTDDSISFGWLFWIWTVVLPLVYIYLGIARKNVILIRVGLLLCIAAALTFRHYYHFMPLELVMILGGALALAISWYLTKYLQTPKHGFTYQELSGNTLMDQLKIESLIISESGARTATAPTDTGTHMGGGKFGGGGASGGF